METHTQHKQKTLIVIETDSTASCAHNLRIWNGFMEMRYFFESERGEVEESVWIQLVRLHVWPPNICLCLTCSLCPIAHSIYLSFSGVQVAGEDAGRLQGSSESPTAAVGPAEASLPQPPVMEAGEAGPPGKMTLSTLPKGTGGSMMPPVQGFAGAPGETYTPPLTRKSTPRTWLTFFFYWTASPVKSADSLHINIPLVSGKLTVMMYYYSNKAAYRCGWTVFLLLSRCDHAVPTIAAETCHGFRSGSIDWLVKTILELL